MQKFLGAAPFLIFVGVFLGVALVFYRAPKTILPDYGQAPDFVLKDQNGRDFRRADLAGKTWTADFIFTRCAMQCPMMSEQMKLLSIGAHGHAPLHHAHFVSFSVDPDYDTPEVLSDYAARFGADPARWHFLTGPRETLNRITTSFHMNTVDEPMFHSASFVLVDGRFRIRGYYDAGDPDRLEQLKKDYAILSETHAKGRQLS